MERAREAIRKLFEWAKARDFKGHDPHDLLEAPLAKFALRARSLRLVALQLGRRSPLNLHRILRVPVHDNPKALALFISGLTRAGSLITDEWREVRLDLLRRLLNSENGGWGYPFGWQSRTHYLKRGTANGVVTCFAGFAFLDVLETEPSNKEANRGAELALRYILDKLPRKENDGLVAFGYAENDPQIVYNASLLAAEYLARYGKQCDRRDLIDLSLQAARLVLQKQNDDGSWIYGEESNQGWIDSFHTGYVLNSLKTIAGITNSTEMNGAIEKGYQYYRRTFFDQSGVPKYFNNRDFPQDSHTAAQAILTALKFDDSRSANDVLSWSVDNLQDPAGFFYYQKHRLFTNRIPYIRWSNAWMFRALAEFVSNEKS